MSESGQARMSSGSFLVRCWTERREVDDQPEVLRVYVRNLRTGEEHYISSIAEVGEFLERDLSADTERPGRPQDLPLTEAG